MGAKFNPVGQVHPWGPSSPLGAKFTPGGKLMPSGTNFFSSARYRDTTAEAYANGIQPEKSSSSGLPDFFLRMIPKQEKYVLNEQKLYKIVIKYPKCL
jgi:hypothetical protein